MMKQLGVLFAAMLAASGSPSRATAQLPGATPPKGGAVPIRPGMVPPPKVAPGVYGLPTVTTGQGPLAGKGPLLPPGTSPIPGSTIGVPPVAPPPGVPTGTPPVAPPPAAGQEKVVLHLTNGFQENITVNLKYVNTQGNVRVLTNPRVIAPGEKWSFTLASEMATVKDNGGTKYMVAIRAEREGFPNAWWGVKGQNGKVEDKNEFVGLSFTAFPSANKTIKNLSKTLK